MNNVEKSNNKAGKLVDAPKPTEKIKSRFERYNSLDIKDIYPHFVERIVENISTTDFYSHWFCINFCI